MDKVGAVIYPPWENPDEDDVTKYAIADSTSKDEDVKNDGTIPTTLKVFNMISGGGDNHCVFEFYGDSENIRVKDDKTNKKIINVFKCALQEYSLRGKTINDIIQTSTSIKNFTDWNMCSSKMIKKLITDEHYTIQQEMINQMKNLNFATKQTANYQNTKNTFTNTTTVNSLSFTANDANININEHMNNNTEYNPEKKISYLLTQWPIPEGESIPDQNQTIGTVPFMVQLIKDFMSKITVPGWIPSESSHYMICEKDFILGDHLYTNFNVGSQNIFAENIAAVFGLAFSGDDDNFDFRKYLDSENPNKDYYEPQYYIDGVKYMYDSSTDYVTLDNIYKLCSLRFILDCIDDKIAKIPKPPTPSAFQFGIGYRLTIYPLMGIYQDPNSTYSSYIPEGHSFTLASLTIQPTIGGSGNITGVWSFDNNILSLSFNYVHTSIGVWNTSMSALFPDLEIPWNNIFDSSYRIADGSNWAVCSGNTQITFCINKAIGGEGEIVTINSNGTVTVNIQNSAIQNSKMCLNVRFYVLQSQLPSPPSVNLLKHCSGMHFALI